MTSNSKGLPYEEYIERIPRYTEFLTPEEHDRRSRALAASNAAVELNTLGHSRDSNELLCLDIGHGEQTALMFAAPHPNEPIGSMMLDFFAELLATDDEFRESLNWRFLIVKCIDYDGTQRNTGWFDGPYTLSNYAQNFYRPPAREQVEWTFPINYETLSFEDPLPETQALMDLIETEAPDFIYSLHNAAFGGCYYYLSERLDSTFETLQAIPEPFDVPLDLGEPEAPWMSEFDDAIWEMPSIVHQYEYLEDNIDADPATVITGGTGSLDYARRFNENVVTLVTELPYFYDERVADNSATDRSRRAVILESADQREAVVDELAAIYDTAAQYLEDTPFKRSVEHFIEQSSDRVEAQRSWARSDIDPDEPATVGQVFDALTVRQYYLLLYYGILLRAIDHSLNEMAEAPPNLLEARSQLEESLHTRLAALREELSYQAIPIWKLVAIQFQAGMTVMDAISDR